MVVNHPILCVLQANIATWNEVLKTNGPQNKHMKFLKKSKGMNTSKLNSKRMNTSKLNSGNEYFQTESILEWFEGLLLWNTKMFNVIVGAVVQASKAKNESIGMVVGWNEASIDGEETVWIIIVKRGRLKWKVWNCD